MVTVPTRLETRTKESSIYASLMGGKLNRRNKSKRLFMGLIYDLSPRGYAAQHRPVFRPLVGRAEVERIRWYPKDGELCLSRTKPEETLVEVRSDSDVQIDRQTWV